VNAGYEKDHEKARNLSLAEAAGTQRGKSGIMEWWKNGRMGKEEDRRQESVDRRIASGILEGWKNQRAEIRASEPRRSEGGGQRSELQSLRNQGAEKNNFPFLFDNIVVFVYYVAQMDNVIF
jgi:hypothetical protein